MLAALRQKQITRPKRVPDREGKRNLPNAPVDLSVLDQKWSPSGGNEALRIISFDPLAGAGIKVAQDTDRRNQALAADRSLQRKSHEDGQVLAQCPVPGQHGIEMAALLQAVECPACRHSFDQARRIDLLAEGLNGLFSIGCNQRVHGAEHAIHPRTGLAAQNALLGFDRVAGAAVHAGQELVIHLDQLVEQCLARLNEVTGDERIALWLGEAAQITSVVAAAKLAKLIDDLGIDLIQICAVCKQLLDQAKAHDITLDRGGCRGLGIILEPEQARTCVALGNFDQEIDCRAKAVRHFGGDDIEQRGGGAGDLGGDDPIKRPRRRKNDPPALQAFFHFGQQIGHTAAIENAFAQPIPEAGLRIFVETFKPEVIADAPCLLALCLRATWMVEEQHGRQLKLA